MTLQTAEYSNFFETTLDGNVAGGDTTITLSALPTSDGTTYIDAPYYLVINPDSTTNREVINVTSHNTSTLQITCTRDVEGRHSPDLPHDTGTTVRMSVVGEMFEDLHDRLNDVALTGDVTGTINSGTQDIATTLASGIDATKIADGSVTSAEFQYIGGLTSDAQTQIDGKLSLSGGTLSGAVNAGDQEISAVLLKDYAETKQAVTSSSGAVAIDLANGNVGTITLTENITVFNFTNVPSTFSTFQLYITQHASSDKTVAISTTVNGGGAANALTAGAGGYTMTTGANKVDIITFAFVGATTPHLSMLQDMRNS